jgi:transposase
MENLLEICCGLDVHKEEIVACLLVGDLEGAHASETRSFSAMPDGLLELKSWLESKHCRHIAMESTGIYWIALYETLEKMHGGEVNLMAVNARHMKNVPGRKTDMRDAEWIAELLRAGLLRGSFIPPKEVRELRKMTRCRRGIVEDIASQKNRVEKHLQEAGFRLSVFISDIFGVSGRNIMSHLVAHGSIDREAIDGCLKTRTRKKIDGILSSVSGRMADYERRMLSMMLNHLSELESHLSAVNESIENKVSAFSVQMSILCSMPGISAISAAAILAEIGPDLDNFPTSAHLSSWAGMSPGNNESAGKRKSTRANPGNKYLKSMLCEVAWVISRLRGTYLSGVYWRIKQRRGSKRAIVAIGRKLLTIIYAMLKSGQEYDEGRFERIAQRNDKRRIARMISALSESGYRATKTATA